MSRAERAIADDRRLMPAFPQSLAWQRLQAARLPETFGVPPKAPQMQPWGIVVCYAVDPSGVLWHVVPAPA